MKEAEYFQQARDDAGFRRDKIAVLKEHKKFTGWTLIFSGTLTAIMWLAVGLLEGRWDQFGGMFGSVILVAWVHANIRTRLAALEAMDGKTVAPASRPLESSVS